MFEKLPIEGVFLYTPRRHGDPRGWFSETFNRAVLEPMTGPIDWMQDNYAYSAGIGTLRGLHFQIAPVAQDKLVRCVRGEVLDVALDIRRGSPTFGKHVAAVLSEENNAQIFVPKGFAHAYVTRTADADVAYKVSAPYAAAHERGIAWDDPALAIDWGLNGAAPILSERDRHWPTLANAPDLFS